MSRSRKKPQHAICRAVKRVSKAQPTQDGAGVSLFRAIGQPALRELDPFLLLDEMRSDQADDYIAGFPSHPHRGFETLSYMVSGEMLSCSAQDGNLFRSRWQSSRWTESAHRHETWAFSDIGRYFSGQAVVFGNQQIVPFKMAQRINCPLHNDSTHANVTSGRT